MFHLFELLGVAVFAVSGVISAGKKNLDLIGVMIVAIVTSIGGGTIRDLLLGRHPLSWISDYSYILVSIAGAVAAIIYNRFKSFPYKALLFADAFGLGLFTINGAQITEQVNNNALIVLLMAGITGAVGGVLRDILCAEVPLILRKDIYLTASIAGTAVYLLSKKMGAAISLCGALGMFTVIALRITAIVWNLGLPHFAIRNQAD